MKRLLKSLGSTKTQSVLLVFAALIVMPSLLYQWRERVAQNQAAQVVAAKAACTLDPQVFLNTVNQWRAAAHVQPLQYSTQLQQSAQARVADMVKYQYYGHTNPQTKEDNGYFTQKYDPAATWWDEVLDGPNHASQSLIDFKNSQPHYTALIDARENYIGLVAEYIPESWASYDNSGNLQTKASVSHSSCIVIADLADKIGQAAPKAASATRSVDLSSNTTSPGLQAFLKSQQCYLVNIQYGNDLLYAQQSAWSNYEEYSNYGLANPSVVNTEKQDYNEAVQNAWQDYLSEVQSRGCAPTQIEPAML